MKRTSLQKNTTCPDLSANTDDMSFNDRLFNLKSIQQVKSFVWMKISILKISTIFLLLSLIGVGCEKNDELLPYHAKGKIIAVTAMCYGETVLIEVENPKGIGIADSFSTIGGEINISYENAIGIPYFSKIGIPDSVPQTVGTWLYFEYRELTEEEKEENLFSPDTPTICLGIYGAPTSNRFIITKIISYQ
jgi:hypothetical protein